MSGAPSPGAAQVEQIAQRTDADGGGEEADDEDADQEVIEVACSSSDETWPTLATTTKGQLRGPAPAASSEEA